MKKLFAWCMCSYVCVCTERDMSLLSLSPPLSVSVSRRLLCSYLRVRYEDIASSADSTVKHVYEWSGLGPVPSRVALWVNENTRLTDCDDQGSKPARSARGFRESERDAAVSVAVFVRGRCMHGHTTKTLLKPASRVQ